MSIFASRTQQTIELPFDPGQTVTIQKLSGRQLQRAASEKQVAAVEFVRRMGGAEFEKELARTEISEEVVARARSNPFNRYDRFTVLLRGIKAWSYSEAVTEQAIEDLSEEAADFLARAILALTLPEEGDAAQKKTEAPALMA